MTFLKRHTENILGTKIILLIVFWVFTPAALSETTQGQTTPAKVVAVVHCDYVPISFLDKTTNEPSGFFVDIMDAIARDSGFQVQYICKNGWPEMISAIESNEADLGALLKSEEREKKLLFSSPIDMTYLSFFSRSQSSADVYNVPASGYTVGVVKGSMSHEQLKNRPGLRLQAENSYEEGIFKLLAGETDLFAGEDTSILKAARGAGLDDRIKKVGKPFVERERGIAVKKNDARLLALLNKSLASFIGSPEYQRIYIKWYGAPAPFWTFYRLLTAGGIFLFIVVCGMLFWRYQSISQINAALKRQIAERKSAEESAREKGRFIESIVNLSPDILYIFDLLEHRNIYSNEGINAVLGYSLDEVRTLGDALLSELMHPDNFKTYVEETFPRYAQAKDGERIKHQYRMRHKSGEWRWLDCTETIYQRLPGGAPQQILGVVHDITEQRRDEQKLISVMKAIDATSDAIGISDDQGHHFYQNKALSNLFGYATAAELEAAGGGLAVVKDPEVAREMFESIMQGKSWAGELEMVTKNGRVFPAFERADAIKDNDGNLIGLIGIITDITERKLAERQIRESEEYTRNILDTVDDGFIIVDRDYRIITANNAYCDQVAQPIEEVVGRHCYEVSHLATRPCFEAGEECAVREVFVTGRPNTTIHKHVNKDGEKVFVETKAFPSLDQTGNVVSAIETIRNINERHLLEAERLKTQKLESIGVLAGGIAHDFNNILAAILGNINLALFDEGLNNNTKILLSEAEKASLRATNLTQQLLTFARGGEPVKEVSTLDAVIRDSANFALHGANVACRFDIPGDLWLVDIDKGQIGQVIQNIVLNASQAMPEGGTINIKCENYIFTGSKTQPFKNKKEFVKIDIQDNGIGIPANVIEKIFDPYFSTKQKGSGLGLAITHSIVSKHGGFIRVNSSPSDGATFTVYLPASAERFIPGETTQKTESVVKKTKILVMDDDEQVRNLAHAMLDRMGHEVVLAKDGMETVLAYQESLNSGTPIHLTIMDLTIPGGMGGKEAVKKILAINPQAKVLVSSGYSTDPVMASFQEYGFYGAIVKPYRTTDLANIIARVLTPD